MNAFESLPRGKQFARVLELASIFGELLIGVTYRDGMWCATLERPAVKGIASVYRFFPEREQFEHAGDVPMEFNAAAELRALELAAAL